MDLDGITRSLPPLVDGKIHGYLKFEINEILWYRTSPGDVTVIASWWGETDSARFRPVDAKLGTVRSERDTVETYAIRTNFELLEEYLRNCETVELAIISETVNEVVGTAQVTDLQEILREAPYIYYCSVFNKVGTKIGDIPVNIALSNLPRGQKSLKLKRKGSTMPSISTINLPDAEIKLHLKKSFDYENVMPINLRESNREDGIYRSVLKDKRFNINKNISKLNSDVTDKLVAQVVARAQKLRGELIRETNDDDVLAANESSADSFQSENGSEDDQNSALYKYFMGSNMSRRNEKRALEKLRSVSPTPSLIDFATETIVSCSNVKSSDQYSYSKKDIDELSDRENEVESNRFTIQRKEASPIDYVDSLRIAVESLTLTSAGYRRVKSSCLTRGDGVPVSITYFVQYDAAFANVKKYNKKVIDENRRPVKMTSKRQDGQVIHFNHEAVYDLPRSHFHLHTNMPLRFKIFNRHFNQRTPTELGVGSVYIGDAAKSPSLSTTQKLAIVKKGIKIGELKVAIELGCDRIHFGRQFIDAVTSAKENIPVLEVSSNSSGNSFTRYRSAAGSESKPNTGSRVSSAEHRQSGSSRADGNIEKFNSGKREMSKKTDDRIVRDDVPKAPEDKVLLHGLIYIAEGKNLPASNTYLICRAFWRQDRASSRVCADTINPYYNFHQIVPLIHGAELLERTKDNCIITEVYAKNPVGEDNLIGISKLSVNQLYVAFRDPLVLPNLLKSRYPVISTDGWVSIANPVTGRLCGELLALVALGTADQIALLEMTRGIREARDSREYPARGPLSARQAHQRESSVRTQECQTEITTVCDIKSTGSKLRSPEEPKDQQTAVLHTIVDRLAQALTVPKIIANQEAQTEFQVPTREPDLDKEEKNLKTQSLTPEVSNSNSFSGDSFNDNPRESYTMPRGIHRSVGVGAEFDEPVNRNANINYNISDSATSTNSKSVEDAGPSKSNPISQLKNYDALDHSSDHQEESFRAVVEIECALHLPTVELSDGAVEPSTYVTFQKVRGGQNEITDVSPYNCSPKYDWRCDTRLPTELLTNEKMRLIMKVWRLQDPEVSMSINMEKDVVIGFSAIDLSVLTAGFPMVSGWFHITDFAGKCQGQLKVCITPLDNISAFSKASGNSSRAQVSFDHSNFSSPYPQDIAKLAATHNIQTSNVDIPKDSAQVSVEGAFDIGLGFGDASMSFLSQSLKQKLTELDEIKKRLQSRLQDVTSTAFEDDFDNDFDFVEAEGYQEDNDSNGNSVDVNPTPRLPSRTDNNSTDQEINQVNNRITNGNGEVPGEVENNQYLQRPTSDNNTNSLEANLTDTGYSSGSNIRSTVPATNGHGTQPRTVENLDQNLTSVSNGQYVDTEYPVRGTRMHISHLLDKLSVQLTSTPAPITNLPMKRNIMDLISTLRRNNNNFSNDIKCNRQANVRTVPTQTDTNFISNVPSNNSAEIKRNKAASNDDDAYKEDEIPAKTQKREKISTIVREELVADDQNDTSEYDELSSHLMTSNIRHMDMNNILNPLLYSHVIPDISDLPELPEAHATGAESTNSSVTPEGDTIEILDSRYAESFSATINKSLGRLRNLLDVESSSSQIPRLSTTTDSTEVFRVTPSGVPENADGNIDVTVIHKPCNDDLMASNSMESTTTVSIDNTMQTGTEIDDNSSLNSTETSVSAVSRQAPDGGNTVEDPSRPILLKRRNHSEESSSES